MDLSSLNIFIVPTMQIILCVVIASLFKIAMHVPNRKKVEHEHFEREEASYIEEEEEEEDFKLRDSHLELPSFLSASVLLSAKPPTQPKEEEEKEEEVEAEETSVEKEVAKAAQIQPRVSRTASLDAQLGSGSREEAQAAVVEYRKSQDLEAQMRREQRQGGGGFMCCFGGGSKYKVN